MHAYDIKFSASAVEDWKQLVGNFYGVFDNDTQIAEYFRKQAQSLLEYADRLDEIVEERRLRVERGQPLKFKRALPSVKEHTIDL